MLYKSFVIYAQRYTYKTQIDKNINFLVANKQIHEQFT